MVESVREFAAVFLPLLIIMDPVGVLPLFLSFTEQQTARDRIYTAALASTAAGMVLAAFALSGDTILRFFNIGLPAFRLAGGFIFFIYSLQMLQLIPGGIKATREEEREGIRREHVALVPLATPLLAGPGAITVVLVWSQSPQHPVGLSLLATAIAAACATTFLILCLGQYILNIIGLIGIRVLTRLMGLLLTVIAVQIMMDGILELRSPGGCP